MGEVSDSDEGLNGVVVFGMEAHGSVLQTALDLLREGVAVYIPIDCVASRPGREADFDAAIQMLEAAGAVITTAETLLLQASPAPPTPPLARPAASCALAFSWAPALPCAAVATDRATDRD